MDFCTNPSVGFHIGLRTVNCVRTHVAPGRVPPLADLSKVHANPCIFEGSAKGGPDLAAL